MNDVKQRYGLRLTKNSKTGPAFSMSRSFTCINKTAVCAAACYGNGFRYQSPGQMEKRNQNFRTVELLFEKGGVQALTENLLQLIDDAKPANWITSQLIKEEYANWTIRIHDIGDFFFSLDYVNAWKSALVQRPACSAWFYTRSFRNQHLFAALTELASLPNCQGWISVDRENYKSGIRAYLQSPSIWKLAILQESEDLMPADMLSKISELGRPERVISFPKHRAGKHVEVLNTANITVCPQILGALPLETDPQNPKPCQICAFCLPKTAAAQQTVKTPLASS